MIAYFDTSALLKIILPEPGSSAAAAALDGAEWAFASMVIYAEARAAVAAAVRHGRLAADGAAARVDGLVRSMFLVEPSRRVIWNAGDLAERHGLRGYDAVHLASALDVDEDVVVVAADMRLLNAARAERLRVLLPN